MNRLIGVIFFLTAVLTACTKVPLVTSQATPGLQTLPLGSAESDIIEFDGTVICNKFAGGFCGLLVGETRLDPLILPKSFRQHNLKVRIRAKYKDWDSDRNWGRMIHVVWIEEIQ